MPYTSLTDFQAFVSPQVVLEIYDDRQDGTVNTASLNEDIQLSDAMVDAKLARVYPGPFPIIQTFAAWGAATGYAGDAFVVPTVATGFAFQALNAGTSGGTQPTWPAVLGSTVVDGTITWNCVPVVPRLVKLAGLWYLKAFAWQRDPERVRQDGDKWMKHADSFAEDLCEAKAFLNDLIGSPQPLNVGAIIYNVGNNMTLDSGGLSVTGDF
jgi:hypothetical protein